MSSTLYYECKDTAKTGNQQVETDKKCVVFVLFPLQLWRMLVQ